LRDLKVGSVGSIQREGLSRHQLFDHTPDGTESCFENGEGLGAVEDEGDVLGSQRGAVQGEGIPWEHGDVFVPEGLGAAVSLDQKCEREPKVVVPRLARPSSFRERLNS
jgi:hypothetical protein